MTGGLGIMNEPPQNANQIDPAEQSLSIGEPHLLGMHGEYARQIIPIPASGLLIGVSGFHVTNIIFSLSSKQVLMFDGTCFSTGYFRQFRSFFSAQSQKSEYEI
jgi:hypothetical protein